jgi:hypothetical protein
MTNLHVRACIFVLLLVFTAACGDDDDNGTTVTTGQTIPTTPTTAAGGTTIRTTSTTVPGLQLNVTDGAVCSPLGARGQTRDGLALVCGAGAAGGAGESRWRPA